MTNPTTGFRHWHRAQRPVTWPIEVYKTKVKDIGDYTERMFTSDAPTYLELERQLAVAVDVLKETQRQLNERSQQAVDQAQQLAGQYQEISDLRTQIANIQGAYRTKDLECEDLKRRLAIAERPRA